MATYVNAGIVQTVKLLNGVSTAPMKYLQNGWGSTAEGESQTSLIHANSDSGMALSEATCSYDSSYMAKWTQTWQNDSGSAVTVREVGIFDNGPYPDGSGNMLVRHVYDGDISVGNHDSITVIVIFTQART
jgi:hypothetical protein